MKPYIRYNNNQGFTLLELVLAVALFSLVTAGAFAAINSLVNVRDAQLKVAEQLQQLQLLNHYLERDITQLIPRDVRSGGVNREPAVMGQSGLFRGTRVGWANPLGQQRSHMQRFQYRLQNNQLLREYWIHVDNDGRLPDISTALLDEVRSLQIRYQNAARQWQNNWPVNNNSNTILPRAVETTIELTDGRRIRRVFLTIAASGNRGAI